MNWETEFRKFIKSTKLYLKDQSPAFIISDVNINSHFFENHVSGIRILLACIFLFVTVSLIQQIRDAQRKISQELDVRVLSELPGPKPTPFLGNAHQLWSSTDRYKTLLKWCLTYGPACSFRLGKQYMVLLSSTSYVQKLLSSCDNGHLNKGSDYKIFLPFWNDGLVLSQAEKWRTRRKLLSRAFTFQSFIGYMHVYNKASRILADQLEQQFCCSEDDNGLTQDGKSMQKLLWDSTLHVICETTMGVDLWKMEDKGTSVAEALNTNKSLAMMRVFKPWLLIDWVWYFHPNSKKLSECAAQLKEFTLKVLEAHQKDREREKHSKALCMEHLEIGRKKQFTSMIEEMMDAGIDSEGIVEEAQTIISTGYETTATTLQFLLFLLALHPEHQKICWEEVDQLFQNESLCPKGDFTFESLSTLKHLERCIFETLRLFPVAFMFFRQLDKPLKLEDNLELPSKTNVGIFIPAVHRNPEYYPEPDKFDPDRFLPDNKKDRSQFAFIPFSAGQRNCIGYKFGLLEVKVLAARVLHHFHIKTTDKMEDVQILPEIVLTPERGYNFILTKRQNNNNE